MVSTLPGLPDELLLRINEYLSTNDLLKFRLTSDSIAAAAATTIAERLNRLYIHPSEPALRAVPLICAHPVFGPAITEIVLIGYTPYKEVRECERSDYKRHIPHWRRTFATWPHVFPRSKVDVLSEDQEPLHTIQALQRSMAQLPNLHKIAFAHKIAIPGFNQVTRAVIKALPKRHIGKRTATTDSRFHDVQAFADIMNLPLATNFTELHITKSMPFSSPGGLMTGWTAVNLSKVTLPLDLSQNFGAERDIARDWILYVARLLNELHNVEQLTLELNAKEPITGQGSSLLSNYVFGLRNTKLTHRTFPLLRRLCIRASNDCRTPPVQLVDQWLDFLRRHARTLQVVSISNVLMPDEAITTMVETVRQLRDGGIQVCYRLNRLDHKPACNGTQCPEQQCVTWYGVTHEGLPINARLLDKLADEMGVKLSEDGKYWDFGAMEEGELMGELSALRLTI